MRSRIALAVLALAACPARSPAQAALAPAPSLLPQALTTLNDAFRAAYADAKVRVLASSGPTLIVNGDDFILLRDGKRTEANLANPLYDALKTITHIPLAIYVTLTPGDAVLDDAQRTSLARLRSLVPPAQSSLTTLPLSAASAARQKQIVDASLAFLDGALRDGKFDRSQLLAFTRRMAPPIMQNVADATHAQLDAVHAQVSAWRGSFSPEQWSQLHVVIIGPHMPREDLVVTQYFLRLLHEPREGRRVVYAESLWEEPKALDLLGTHLLDGGVGEAFFGDYMRMHRDLLGAAARQYLTKLLPD
jgi:hypothetical protein